MQYIDFSGSTYNHSRYLLYREITLTVLETLCSVSWILQDILSSKLFIELHVYFRVEGFSWVDSQSQAYATWVSALLKPQCVWIWRERFYPARWSVIKGMHFSLTHTYWHSVLIDLIITMVKMLFFKRRCVCYTHLCILRQFVPAIIASWTVHLYDSIFNMLIFILMFWIFIKRDRAPKHLYCQISVKLLRTEQHTHALPSCLEGEDSAVVLWKLVCYVQWTILFYFDWPCVYWYWFNW